MFSKVRFGVVRFFLVQYTKAGEDIPNDHNMAMKYTYQMTNGHNIQIPTFFNTKALQNISKLRFLGMELYYLATLVRYIVHFPKKLF
jgi:hypothetical protein